MGKVRTDWRPRFLAIQYTLTTTAASNRTAPTPAARIGIEEAVCRAGERETKRTASNDDGAHKGPKVILVVIICGVFR
jgi:hypothetical protein